MNKEETIELLNKAHYYETKIIRGTPFSCHATHNRMFKKMPIKWANKLLNACEHHKILHPDSIRAHRATIKDRVN